MTALLGPNGAGKSSLVLAVGGVLRPRAGSVLLDGRDLARSRPERIRRAGVAIVPEGRRLLGDLTVEENLRVATYALPPAAARSGRERALDLFPELGRLAAPARTLSGGEQQMLVLAQALVSGPRYVLIDELSLGLAPVVPEPAHPGDPCGRRVRDRGAADRAVRHAGAGPGRARLRDGGQDGCAFPGQPAGCAISPSCSGRPTCCAAAPGCPFGAPPWAGATAER